METVNVKRSRKLNWSQAEVDELRNSYLEFRSVIDGRLGVTLTNFQKEQVSTRRGIQERINAQSKETRTLDEIKKKLSDMKTAIKKKERERRQFSTKTGGGPAPILNEQEEKMIEAIWEVAVGGFEGVDTFSISVENYADDDEEKIMSLLEDQTQVLKEILEEQRKTNKQLS